MAPLTIDVKLRALILRLSRHKHHPITAIREIHMNLSHQSLELLTALANDSLERGAERIQLRRRADIFEIHHWINGEMITDSRFQGENVGELMAVIENCMTGVTQEHGGLADGFVALPGPSEGRINLRLARLPAEGRDHGFEIRVSAVLNPEVSLESLGYSASHAAGLEEYVSNKVVF
jgi:type II secretory ATPase GspE/PulE/Tfp pilus assembly ATPase PilB-like protein